MNRLIRWTTIAALVVVLAGCTSGTKLPSPLPAADVARYPANAGRPLLVNAGWLAERISSQPDSLVILDASSLRVYRGGHLPGAVHAWWQDAMDPNGVAYGMILKPDQNAADPQRLRRNLIEDLGVSVDSQIVIYDDVDNRDSARLLWMLTFLGYPQASLLDGGLAAWLGTGGKIETTENGPRGVDDPPIEPQQDRYVWKDKLAELLSDPTTQLVDVRTNGERDDDIDGTIETGSIPGSTRIPWQSLLDPTSGRLLDPDSLQAVFDRAGLSKERPVLLYGRFGLESAYEWFALTMLEYPRVLIYDGGWAEWAQDPNAPKEPLEKS